MSTQLTKAFLKKESLEFDLETIFIMKLSGRSISELGCIGMCTSLVSLDLSHNNLQSVMALRSLSQLETLDISVNKLTALSGLEQLDALRRLNVCGNLLNNIDCLLPLTKVQTLRSLTLEDRHFSNPLLKQSSNGVQVRSNIVQMLRQLDILDGELLSGEGAELKQMCEDIEHLVEQYMNVEKLSCSVESAALFTVDPCYLQIGIEKNKVYDEACAVAAECETLSGIIHQKLEEN